MIGLRFETVPGRLFALVFQDSAWQVLEIHGPVSSAAWTPMSKLYDPVTHLRLPIPKGTRRSSSAAWPA